ncbi:MAG TPA: 2'-5' RNA ligase family protein [Anaerolineaceae bacterium]
MFAIATLINATASSQVQSFWDTLDMVCGLAGIKVTPNPHFSWQSADRYTQNELDTILTNIAKKTKPFYTKTTGLGIFTGEKPVLYLPVVKTSNMTILHNLIWDSVKDLAVVVNHYYAPDTWMPHITLAIRDVDSENIACAVKHFLSMNLSFEVRVDHFALVYAINEQIGTVKSYKFEGDDDQH